MNSISKLINQQKTKNAENRKLKEAEHHAFMIDYIASQNKVLLQKIINNYSDILEETNIAKASLYEPKITRLKAYTSDAYAPYNPIYFGFDPITNKPEITSLKKSYYFHFENIYDAGSFYSEGRESDMAHLKETRQMFCEILEHYGIIFDWHIFGCEELGVFISPKSQYLI